MLQNQAQVVPYPAIIPTPRSPHVGQQRIQMRDVLVDHADATAWAGRHQEVLAATWTQPLGLDEVDASFAPLQALGTGTYGAYSSDTRASAAALAWPGATGDRLRRIAEQADPERLFDRGLVLRRD